MTYTTKQGDRWDAIAYKVLGDENYMSQLIAENKQYRDVYIFPAGVTLVIPEVTEPAESSAPPWRR